MEHFIEFRHVSKTYTMGEVRINALHDADFVIDEGELCVIVGPSGAGKTTLLNILGGMDTLTEGEVFVGGRDISRLGVRELTAYRRYEVGFVFQFYNLIQNLTALENIEMATHISHVETDAAEILTEVGLADRCRNFPAQLSGGEQQRVSIARALAKNRACSCATSRRARSTTSRGNRFCACCRTPRENRDDGGHHHTQQCPDRDGRPRHPRQERHGGTDGMQRRGKARRRD